MRRIYIIFYWLFKHSNGVKLSEIIRFLIKPSVRTIGNSYIDSIHEDEPYFQIKYKSLPDRVLFWPKTYAVSGIFQVTAETFDKSDWHNYQAIYKVKDSDVLIDVGAAEGLFALSVVHLCKKVILVEPNAQFVEALKKTFLSFSDKVHIYECAVGEKNGYVGFSNESLTGSVSSNRITNQVEIKTIDGIVSNETKITFLKADIEGFELAMLKGAENTIKRSKPKIVITTYHKENDAEEIIALVKSFVPQYNVLRRGIFHEQGKPVTVHFWID
jgi:FkbM family methyltransferase